MYDLRGLHENMCVLIKPEENKKMMRREYVQK